MLAFLNSCLGNSFFCYLNKLVYVSKQNELHASLRDDDKHTNYSKQK